MERPVHQLHLEVDQRESAQRPFLRRVADAVLDRGDELPRDDPAHDAVLELHSGPARKRLQLDVTVAVLTAPAALPLVLALRLGAGQHRLVVRRVRQLQVHVDVELPLQLLDGHLDVHLPHALEQRLVGLGIARQLQRGILLEQLVQRHARLLLLLAIDLQRVGDDPLRLSDQLQAHRSVGGGQGVADVHVTQLHQADDLARRGAGDLRGVVSVDAVDVGQDLFLVGARVVELLPGLHLPGEDAAGGKPSDEVVHRVPEGEKRGRLIGARRPHHFLSVAVLSLDLAPAGGIRQVAHDGARQIAHAHARARRAGQHGQEAAAQYRVSQRVPDLLLAGLLTVQVLLQEHVVRLGHGLHQPRPQLLRVPQELLGDVLLDVPAELAVLPPRIGMRA